MLHTSKPRAVLLSSSPLTDRILLFTTLLETLSRTFEVHIWATSSHCGAWKDAREYATVSSMPDPSRGLNRLVRELRRADDYAWVYALHNPSRLSMMKHLIDPRGNFRQKAYKWAGKTLAKLKLHRLVDRLVRNLVTMADYCPKATEKLKRIQPDILVSFGPQLNVEPWVVNSAKRLGIFTTAYITSWDNLSTKSRLLHDYDAYIVWTNWMLQELTAMESRREIRVYVVGAPQFDVCFEERFHVSREEFCMRLGLNAKRPIVVAAMGMANGIDEYYLAEGLARSAAHGELADAQLVVRPHPFFHSDPSIRDRLKNIHPEVVVQLPEGADSPRQRRCVTRESIVEWVNTFRHANCVVHLSSTAAVDAAIFDVPSVCLDFDPSPGGRKTQLVREVNRSWLHYRRVVQTNGTRLASNWHEVKQAVRSYIENPYQDRQARRSMVELVAGETDGKAAERLTAAIESCYEELVKQGRRRLTRSTSG